MSNNPWPFVVVALMSLGFLANSMAQQNNLNGDVSDANGASMQFNNDRRDSGDLPQLSLSGEDGDSQWDSQDRGESEFTPLSSDGTGSQNAGTRDRRPRNGGARNGDARGVRNGDARGVRNRVPRNDGFGSDFRGDRFDDDTPPVFGQPFANETDRATTSGDAAANISGIGPPAAEVDRFGDRTANGQTGQRNEFSDTFGRPRDSRFSSNDDGLDFLDNPEADDNYAPVSQHNAYAEQYGDQQYRENEYSESEYRDQLFGEGRYREQYDVAQIEDEQRRRSPSRGGIPPAASNERPPNETFSNQSRDAALIGEPRPFYQGGGTRPSINANSSLPKRESPTTRRTSEAKSGINKFLDGAGSVLRTRQTSGNSTADRARGGGLNSRFDVAKPATYDADGNLPESTASEEDATKSKLPLWSTMALFASLAANLFFGWIAWDTHSRYQEFVEEVNEGDTRQERRSRRLRSEPVSSTSSHRSSREQDEADFLRGGIEV